MNKTQDQKVMYVLKASSLKHHICKTNLGELELNITKDANEYFFTLDSVPVSKEANKTLLELYQVNG